MRVKVAYTVLGFTVNLATCRFQDFIAEWDTPVADPDTRPGGLDFGLCCRRYLKDAIIPENTRVMVKSEFQPVIQDFQSKSSNSSDWTKQLEDVDRYPCDSPLTVNWHPVPVIPAHYTWCKDNCPGWQRSLPDSLQQWM